MTGRHAAVATRQRARFSDVLRIRVFLLLYAAETQSIVGDQLARVALSVLVFEETGSAPATAATYAATLLPAVLGGIFLSRLGDRYPRRGVMIGCDLLRALCFGVMAIPAVPLPAVVVLVVVSVTFGPVFSAAEVSYLSVRLTPENFRSANALRMISIQAAVVAGFVFGGLVVALVNPRTALSIDAATFLLSALLVSTIRGPRLGTRVDLPGSGSESAGNPASTAEFRGLRKDRRLRTLVAITLLAGFFVVPEGLAVPFGASVGASKLQVGMLLGAGAFGGAIGATLLVKTVASDRRSAVASWMAVMCGVPLAVSVVKPSWQLAALCWFASGLLAAYIVETSTIIVQAIPDSHRSHLVGIVSALLLGAQGLGLVAFGALAQVTSASAAIACAGGVGSMLAAVLVVGPLRASSRESQPLQQTNAPLTEDRRPYVK